MECDVIGQLVAICCQRVRVCWHRLLHEVMGHKYSDKVKWVYYNLPTAYSGVVFAMLIIYLLSKYLNEIINILMKIYTLATN